MISGSVPLASTASCRLSAGERDPDRFELVVGEPGRRPFPAVEDVAVEVRGEPSRSSQFGEERRPEPGLLRRRPGRGGKPAHMRDDQIEAQPPAGEHVDDRAFVEDRLDDAPRLGGDFPAGRLGAVPLREVRLLEAVDGRARVGLRAADQPIGADRRADRGQRSFALAQPFAEQHAVERAQDQPFRTAGSCADAADGLGQKPSRAMMARAAGPARSVKLVGFLANGAGPQVLSWLRNCPMLAAATSHSPTSAGSR